MTSSSAAVAPFTADEFERWMADMTGSLNAHATILKEAPLLRAHNAVLAAAQEVIDTLRCECLTYALKSRGLSVEYVEAKLCCSAMDAELTKMTVAAYNEWCQRAVKAPRNSQVARRLSVQLQPHDMKQAALHAAMADQFLIVERLALQESAS